MSSIRTILWKDWDPIGCGVPGDEYDSYIPGVFRLLEQGADEFRLRAHLKNVAEQSVSCPISDERAALVARKLLDLRIGK